MMMLKIFKKISFLIALFAIATIFKACSGPASAPPPPIELPSPAVLKFVSYEGLQIDLTKISPTGPLLNVNKALPVGSNATYHIKLGPIFFNTFFDEVFIYVIAGIEQLEIPTIDAATEAPTTRYETDITFENVGNYLTGLTNVKLDFGVFDYDNDGVDEECSGNAAQTPICVRCWLDNKSFLAGVFVEPPVYSTDPVLPDKIGKGKFKIKVEKTKGFDGVFAYEYEGKESENIKRVEYFFRLDRNYIIPVVIGSLKGIVEWDGHSLLSKIGPNESAFKNLNVNSQIDGSIYYDNLYFKNTDLRYLGQFVEGYDFWGGNVFMDVQESNLGFDPFPFDETDICARISTGLTVEVSNCNDVGGYNIRTVGLDYISVLTTQDVAFPTDFPTNPPF